MSGLERVLVVAGHNLRLVAAEPGPAISRLVMPVAMMLMLRPLYSSALGGQGPGTRQAVVGMLVMFSLLGVSVTGNSVLLERSWHTLDRLRATPARPVELLAGKAVPAFLLVTAQQVVILAVGIAVLGLPVADLGLLALALAGWVAALLSLGFAIAMLVRSHAELSAVTDIGSMALTCLGGALVPLATMPAWAQTLAPISPGYWAVRGLQSALSGDAAGTLTSVAVLAGVAAIAAAVAVVRLARGWGSNHVM